MTTKHKVFITMSFVITLMLLILWHTVAQGSDFTEPVVLLNPRTDVSGGIYTDTVWSLAQSPYIVTGDITLFPGYTLTIEPGVQVRFDANTALIIRGALVAEGTETGRIVFTSNDPAPDEGSWRGVEIATNQGGNASVAFANFEYAATALSVQCCWGGGPVNISDSVFRRNMIALGGYAGWDMIVDRCTFEYNTYAVTQADKVISDSVFRNNDYGLYETERISVYSSYFTGHQVALYGGRREVKCCTIANNDTGVEAFFEGFSLSYNNITNNTIGIIMKNYDGFSPPVTYNNIHSNSAYNLRNGTSTNKNAPNNWWGTTDTSVIDAGIYDGYDDPALGLINYNPILTQPVPVDTICYSETGIIDPEVGGTVVYTDPGGLTTSIKVPGGAVTDTTLIQYTSRFSPTVGVSGFLFAGHAFKLEAFVNGVLQPGFVFSKPVTITIHYADADVAGMNETMLLLYTWDGSQWVPIETCGWGYKRDPANNLFQVQICHLSEYALFGEKPTICLPVIIREYTP